MTPAELHAAHKALFGNEAGTARFFRLGSERTVRGWWNGIRNGQPAEAPGPVQVLTEALVQSRAVREHFGLALPEDQQPSG